MGSLRPVVCTGPGAAVLTRPDLPVDNRTFGEWCLYWNVQLMDWFKASHGHDAPSAEEWGEYCWLMFGTQITIEREFE